MHLGLDLDNTIANYDFAFYAAGREQDLIPAETPRTKVGVKTFLSETRDEEAWTELQGYVYGPGIKHATLFPAFKYFLDLAVAQGWRITIISHKTRYPYLGPKFDLHASATEWLDSHGITKRVSAVYFETTKEAKLDRIATQEADYFVDDLPEILCHEQFPAATHPILFDPGNCHQDEPFHRIRSWDNALEFFDSRYAQQK